MQMTRCKYCEVENSEMVVDTDETYFYIMNNIGYLPRIMYGSRNPNHHDRVFISYCPFCGARLVDVENLHKEG